MDVEISNIFESRRGKRCFNIDNYKFSEFRVLKSGFSNYRCTNKKCPASVIVKIQNNTKYKIIKVTNSHNHEEYNNRTITREIIRSAVKRSAESDLYTKPNKLIRRELRNTENFTTHLEHNDVKLLRISMYETRKKHYSNLPKSFEDARNQLIDKQNDIQYQGNKFCFPSDDENIFIFTCKKNLELLKYSEHVFGDGTFSFAPNHFVQLYTIHVFLNNFYIPVAYCFLRNKHTNTYIHMWQSLHNIRLQMTGNKINLIHFHADFEKAAHNAVLQIFPQCKIFGCTFHLGQNWFRQIQQNNILLSEYFKNSEIGKWMKYFYGLSYLPPNEVSDGFTDLMAIAPHTVSFIFSDYILENYID